MLDALTITQLHDDTTAAWHVPGTTDPDPAASDLASLIRAQHRANFDLWHEEDKARDPVATDHQIAEVKRAIDRLNQRRNDLVEQVDTKLLAEFQSHLDSHPEAPLHSETPGLMIDRLSILSLKIFHTREEAQRTSATEQHRQRNRDRLALLEEQRTDLGRALDALFSDIAGGRRRFKLYRQMKMYNDPELNPAMYHRKA
jgi:hypothetical protein